MIDPNTVTVSSITVRDHNLIAFVQPHGMESRIIALPCSALEFFEGHIAEAFTRAYERSTGNTSSYGGVDDYFLDYAALFDDLSTTLRKQES